MSQNSNKRNPVISDVKITKKGVDEALAAGNTHARFKNKGVQRRLLKNQELVRKEQERKDTAARHRAKYLKKAKEAKDLITQPAAPAVVDNGAKALLSLFDGISSAEAIAANEAGTVTIEEDHKNDIVTITSNNPAFLREVHDKLAAEGIVTDVDLGDSSSNVARMREAIQNQRADIGYGQVDVGHLDSNFGVQHQSQEDDGIVLRAGDKLHRALSNIPKYTINNGEVALNLYGDENNYKPFPEIGDSIRADGIVRAVRPVEQDPSLEELKKMVEPNIITDKITYSAPGVVVDNKDDIVVQLEPSPSIESQGLATMGAMPPDDIIFDLRNPKLIDRYGMASVGEQPSSYQPTEQQIKDFEGDELNVLVVNHETGLKHFGLKQEVGPESVLHLNPWEHGHGGSRKQMFAGNNLCEEILTDPTAEKFQNSGVRVPPQGFKFTDTHGGSGVIPTIYPDDEDQLAGEAAAISAGSGEFCPAAAMSEAETNRMIHGTEEDNKPKGE